MPSKRRANHSMAERFMVVDSRGVIRAEFYVTEGLRLRGRGASCGIDLRQYRPRASQRQVG